MAGSSHTSTATSLKKLANLVCQSCFDHPIRRNPETVPETLKVTQTEWLSLVKVLEHMRPALWLWLLKQKVFSREPSCNQAPGRMLWYLLLLPLSLCFFFILAQSKSIFTNVHRVGFLEGPCFGGPPNRGALNATIKTCIARQLESLENVRKQDTEHWRTTIDFTHFRLVIQLINTSQASSYCVPQREHFIQSDEMIATIRWPNTEIHQMIILSL